MRAPLLCSLALLCAPTLLAAQSVRGTLRDDAGQPVPGAQVLLRGAAGRVVASGTTDEAGGFLLTAPAEGRYTVQADRIGFAPTVSAPLHLVAGRTERLDLAAGRERVALEGITVRGRRRCELLPEQGREVVRVWDEARKALRGTDLTARDRLYQYAVRSFERRLHPVSRVVLHDTSEVRTGMSGTPFITVEPERLLRDGYVERKGDSLAYYAPDARTLLSDDFVEQHCFRLQAPPQSEPGLIGLAFEPVRDRELPDIEGVLWLDRATSELRRLEYHYVHFRIRRALESAGGEMEFRRLPRGHWIISRWTIRMPVLEPDVNRDGWKRPPPLDPWNGPWRVAALREEGGEVTSIATSGGVAVPVAPGAVLVGTVYDSTQSAGLAGAWVSLVGTRYSAVADSAGRFVLRDLPEGVYSVVFSAPRADSLGFTAVPVQVALTRGSTTRRDLALPSQPRAPAQVAVERSVTLDPLRVTAAPRDRSLEGTGFYARQEAGSGVFFTRAQFGRRTSLEQVLRDVPGLRLVRYYPPKRVGGNTAPPGETRVTASRSTAIDPTGGERTCWMPVYVDGIPVARDSREPGNGIDDVTLADVLGVEVYRIGDRIPLRYAPAGPGCGVVLVWTQSGPQRSSQR